MQRRTFLKSVAASSVVLCVGAEPKPTPIRSARSGRWSSPETWENKAVPAPGSTVEVLPGHTVIYDVQSDRPIRMVRVLGTLSFARDRDTRLDVGLLKIGGDASEDGATLSHHSHSGPRPALEIGTPDDPLPAAHSALIRLVYFEGFDKDSLPALVCCGGRMDLHGAPMSRTWVKLGVPVRSGDVSITLAEPVSGWRAGDRIILTATVRQIIPEDTFTETVTENTQTEERIIRSISETQITLDKPVQFDHRCEGQYRGDVANLSRNITIESAGAGLERGHTMYHHGSSGAISYAEFRRLGKLGTLGRYSIHFHQVRDSMRGASVIGASIWQSDNRWITVHGTDYLVVRDCVGYNSVGHGFFLEDGTEVFNVFDRNLAVQGRKGKILANQVLPFDENSGSGFWWANCLNTFTRNVACECDVYGFRFDMQKAKGFNPVLRVPQLDGSGREADVRTLPFVRFEDNEAHCQRNFALNLAGLNIHGEGGCDGVGPDVRHPFIIRNMRVWNSHWSFHTLAPDVLVDGFDMHDCAYGIWQQHIHNHVYRGMHMEKIKQHVSLNAKGDLPKSLGDGSVPGKDVFDLVVPDPDTPNPLSPVIDLAPVVIATQVSRRNGAITIRGTATAQGTIRKIQVNGHEARALRSNFAEWGITIPAGSGAIVISAEDTRGNVSHGKVAQAV
jgi:hypothetical protein